MSREAIQEMIERWMSEPAFKDELRANPSTTVAKYGYLEKSGQPKTTVIHPVDVGRHGRFKSPTKKSAI